MANIWNIVIKNFRLLVRSKSSSLIVILGPLLIIFLVGMAFNTSNLYDLRLGIYTSSYSELTNSLVDGLKGDFLVTELDNQDDCINGVKSSEFNVCAVIPANLQITTKDNIIFYVDYSRVNLVYNIISVISDQLTNESTKLSTELTSDLLTRLDNAKYANTNQAVTDINNIKKNLDDLQLKDSYSTDDNATEAEKDLAQKLEDVKAAADRSLNIIATLAASMTQSKDSISSVGNTVDSVINTVSSLSVNQASDIVSPIKTKIEPLTSEEAHINYLFPTLLILVLMFISILLASTLLINEKATFAYFRNFITPTSGLTFLIGNFLTNWLIAVFEVLLIIIFSAIFLFKTNFLVIALLSIMILSVGSVVFILIGMIIGYSFRSSETANLAAISISSIMLFFSNTVLPLEALPTYIKSIVMFNPFVVIESMLKKVILFNANLGDQGWNFLILLSYILLLGLIAYLASESTKRRL